MTPSTGLAATPDRPSARHWPATAVRVPAPARIGEGVVRGAGRPGEGDRRPADPGANLPAVGSHKELLAYLVRRLLENGANSSFVNRIADEQVSLDELVRDPVAELEALEPKRNPKIVLPPTFRRRAPQQRRVDLRDPLVREPLLERLKALESRSWTAKPGLGRARARRDLSPHDRRIEVGTEFEASAAEVDRMVRAGHAAQVGLGRAWRRSPRPAARPRGRPLRGACGRILLACIREAGKTLIDAVLEVREAVDFLRFYAAEARRQFTRPLPLPGPTGEQNELRLHGRGVFASISPVEFPAGDLHRPGVRAAGRGQCRHRQAGRANAADRRAAVELMHQAGIPKDIVQLAPGSAQGRRRNADRHPLLCGRRVHRLDRDRAHDQPHARRARRPDHPVHRRNRRPECNDRRQFGAARASHARRISSAFQSAGQRCSALRVLFVQEDVADGMIAMIAGAMEALKVGDPRTIATDVGPVIDEAAKKVLDEHIDVARQERQEDLPAGCAEGGCERLLRSSRFL